MKWLIIVFLLLVVGAILGPISSGNAGYVLVQFAGWSVETSVIALCIMAVVLFVVISLVLTLINAFFSRTKKGSQWFGKRRNAKAQRLLHEAELRLLQQDYLPALQAFEKAYKANTDASTAAFAAYAAQQCGELGKSEFWRSQAGKAFEKADGVIQLKYIDSIKAKDPDAAARRLEQLLAEQPHYPQPWILAIEVYGANHQWKRLIELLPDIERYSGKSASTLEALKKDIYFNRFVDEGRKGSDALYTFWRSLDKNHRAQNWVRLSYARALKHMNQKEACAKVLYKGLKRGDLTIAEVNDADLLCADYSKLIEFVQETLKRNPNHSDYIRALAQLAYDNKDYSLAQRALKKLVDSEASRADYKLLGDVYNSLGDGQLAANAYKKALAAA